MSYTKENLEYVLSKLLDAGCYSRRDVFPRITVCPSIFKGNCVGLKGWCATSPEYVVNYVAKLVDTYSRSGKNTYNHSANLAQEIMLAAFDYYDTYTHEEMLEEARKQVAICHGKLLATRITGYTKAPLVSTREDAIKQTLTSSSGGYMYGYNTSARFKLYLILHPDEFTEQGLGVGLHGAAVPLRRTHKSLVNWAVNRMLDAWILSHIDDSISFAALLGVQESYGTQDLGLSLYIKAPTGPEGVQACRIHAQEVLAKYLKDLDSYEAAMVSGGVGDVVETAKQKYAEDPLSCMPLLMQSGIDGASKVAHLLSNLYDPTIPVCLEYTRDTGYTESQKTTFTS